MYKIHSTVQMVVPIKVTITSCKGPFLLLYGARWCIPFSSLTIGWSVIFIVGVADDFYVAKNDTLHFPCCNGLMTIMPVPEDSTVSYRPWSPSQCDGDIRRIFSRQVSSSLMSSRTEDGRFGTYVLVVDQQESYVWFCPGSRCMSTPRYLCCGRCWGCRRVVDVSYPDLCKVIFNVCEYHSLCTSVWVSPMSYYRAHPLF